MDEETWRTCSGAPGYEVSSSGRVRSRTTGRVLEPHGVYSRVELSGWVDPSLCAYRHRTGRHRKSYAQVAVARLIAWTYHGHPRGGWVARVIPGAEELSPDTVAWYRREKIGRKYEYTWQRGGLNA